MGETLLKRNFAFQTSKSNGIPTQEYPVEIDDSTYFTVTLLRYEDVDGICATPIELYDPEDTEQYDYSRLGEDEWYFTGVSGVGEQVSFETRSEDGIKINDFLAVTNLSTEDNCVILKDSKGSNNVRIYKEYLKYMKGIIGKIVEEDGKKYFVITDNHGNESWILDEAE